MQKQLFGLSFGFAVLIAATGLAEAQGNNCAAHDVVVERLAEGYGESRQSIAIAANNAIVEVFASAETGTWTITITMPGGPTCLVAAGHSYEELTEALPSSGKRV
jgi:hypothetical protein